MNEFEDIFKSEGYLLDELLDRDEWGELYRARYVPHRRDVLLHRFPTGLADDAAAWDLTRAEVQAWARLDHPGILQVLDWGSTTPVSGGVGREAGREAFLATEVPAGMRLDEFLEGRAAEVEDTGGIADIPPGDLDEAVLRALLEAVEAACRWGVLHLGLCPSSVWVGPGGRVQVGGFGLWYVTRDFPAYGRRDDVFLAPEQRSGERVSAGTDVYSLAMLLIELRCGPGAARAVADGAPVPAMLDEVRPVLTRCLDPRPLARYRSAGELARALGLDAFCAGTGDGADEYRDCPLCRLKGEIQRDGLSGRVRGDRIPGSTIDGARAVSYAWLIAIALAVACVVVWWMALR